MEYELIVVGGGAAGLSAGMYGARSGLRTLVLDKGSAGGLIAEAPWIENYPGLGTVKGTDLIEKLKSHAEHYVEIRKFEPVEDIKISKEFLIKSSKENYKAKAVVLATGTTRKKLGVKGEEEFVGRGVSYCAVCDGYFFRNKKVAVVGGGDTAAVDALYLKNLGCDVTMIHRRDRLRADDTHRKRLEEKVNFCLNSVVKEIVGDGFVKGIRIRNVKDNTEKLLDADGIFVCIGEVPSNELAEKIGVSLDEEGYIRTDKNQRTNVAGVYAAGDVTGGVKQIVVACAEGAIAALSAFEDLRSPYWVKKV
ncbi:MAG TPA: thioredoxin-disulfide reductase [Hadesarchaea archaeon]|nr:thioredoxin-disulfide reductase [Hadesarchaea archaeon]